MAFFCCFFLFLLDDAGLKRPAAQHGRRSGSIPAKLFRQGTGRFGQTARPDALVNKRSRQFDVLVSNVDSAPQQSSPLLVIDQLQCARPKMLSRLQVSG